MIKCLGTASEYLIQDGQGHLFRLDIKKRTTEKILSFHAGAVKAVETSPVTHVMTSLGVDGTLRLYDLFTKSMIARSRFRSAGTAMRYLPKVCRLYSYKAQLLIRNFP